MKSRGYLCYRNVAFGGLDRGEGGLGLLYSLRGERTPILAYLLWAVIDKRLVFIEAMPIPTPPPNTEFNSVFRQRLKMRLSPKLTLII